MSRSTQKELAKEEAQHWENLSTAERSQYGTIRDFWKVRDPSRSQVELRYQLLRVNDARLWEEVHKGLSLNAAVGVLRLARKEQRPLEVVLAEYYRGVRTDLPGGTFCYKKYSRKDDPPPSIPPVEPGDEWQEAARAVERAIRTQLVGEEELFIERLVGRTMLDVRLAFGDAKKSMQRLVSVSPARATVVNDCHRLGVPPPKVGGPLDGKQLWKARKSLLVDLHPDKNGGFQDPAKDAIRTEVEAAYQRLVAYNNQFEGESHVGR